MLCPRCATAQLPNTLFCDRCGTDLTGAASGEATAGRALRCTLLDGGHSLLLPRRGEWVLGRGDNPSGALPDVDFAAFGGQQGGVSRRHARLSRQRDDLYLEDLASTNGTFVNDQRLPPRQRVRVRPGDTIRLGLLRLTLHFV